LSPKTSPHRLKTTLPTQDSQQQTTKTTNQCCNDSIIDTMASLANLHLNIAPQDNSLFQQLPAIEQLETCLIGTSSASPSSPAAKYMRAVYYLRTLGTEHAVRILCQAIVMKSHSPLIRHEIGYVLGQMQEESACATLEAVLSDSTDNVMVRHECAEALGAIGHQGSLPLLERMALKRSSEKDSNQDDTKQNDGLIDVPTKEDNPNLSSTATQLPNVATKEIIVEELRETCEIARDFCRWKSKGAQGERPQVACACMLSPYNSYDPAPPSPETDNLSTAELGNVLLSCTVPLFERYRAMFALRNRGGEECVIQLGRALVEDTSSALLRHEVAYVLGQMAHPAAIHALAESLRRSAEHSMVRHESAEALGAIEGDEEEMKTCLSLLKEFSSPDVEADSVVRESCEVALDTLDYWSNF
jgi:deoxyhypusine monooxygenase